MLSETDLALVNALQVNPRAPWSLIGEALGIGAATAARRWDRLVEQRAAWMTAYPSGELSARMVLALVEVHCAADRAVEVARLLAADAHVTTVDCVAADCDLLLHVVAPSLPEVTDYVVHRLSVLPGVLSTTTRVSPRVFSDGSRWRLLAISPDQTDALTVPPHQPGPPPAFTELDRGLMLALGENGRASYTELAARVGVSSSTARRHVDAFLAGGQVRVRCEIARSESPAPVTVVLWLRVAPDQLETTANLLAMRPEVRMSAAVSGSANLVLVVWLRAPSDTIALESDLVTRMPWLAISDRAVVLRPVKLMGRILDDAGRSETRVPLDFWAPVRPRTTNPGRQPCPRSNCPMWTVDALGPVP